MELTFNDLSVKDQSDLCRTPLDFLDRRAAIATEVLLCFGYTQWRLQPMDFLRRRQTLKGVKEPDRSIGNSSLTQEFSDTEGCSTPSNPHSTKLPGLLWRARVVP